MSEKWDTESELSEHEGGHDCLETRSECNDNEDRITELKKAKAIEKTKFTKLKNKLYKLIEKDVTWPGTVGKHRACIRDVIDELCEIQNEAVDVMLNLIQEFKTDMASKQKLDKEIEKIETEFAEIEEIAQNFLRETKPNKTQHQQKFAETLPKKIAQLNISGAADNTIEHFHHESFDKESEHEHQEYDTQHGDYQKHKTFRQGGEEHNPHDETRVFDNYPNISLGSDMWKQLRRVTIPTFSGDKRQYSNWKAAFQACIDEAPATPEYKFLQLRQYLSGEALTVVQNLGHSAVAYEAAKDRLERKYGGKRRQIAVYLEELDNFRPVRHRSAEDLEKFADLLDIAVINLKDAGRQHELKDGSLYLKLQKKLTEELLGQYHRWIYEHRRFESVETLREFIIQEAAFQTVASETIQGLNSRSKNRNSAKPKKIQSAPGTFFTHREEGNKQQRTCTLCSGNHGTWECEKFKKQSVEQRWNSAKQHNLCYRCLGNNHIAQMCLRTRKCGIDGCKRTHSRLLHQDKENTSSTIQTERKSSESTSTMEGERSHTTTQHSSSFIAMRTVPVILKNGHRQITVNALLDDASTKSYINSEVAAELGLKGEKQKVTVNVLNGRTETFETSPVSLVLQSMDGSVKKTIDVYTADRVTGDLEVVDWNKYAERWPHIEHIKFPKVAKRPLVDILIGCDMTELHCSYRDIRGSQTGEPIARLTPLGWTCIGQISDRNKEYTNFSHRTFVCVERRNNVQEVNRLLKKFWEIEDLKDIEENPVIHPDDQSALKIARESMIKTDSGYQIGIPWKKIRPSLPDSYDMAAKRLCNTEKKLSKDSKIAEAYENTISSYLQKGYIRKLSVEETEPEDKWYLPHFPVVRMDRATTKTRIVFDAAAESKGTSLNSVIDQGPKLQRELFDVLLRFRRHQVALISDIAEMYLRIELTPQDRPFHRFLWRNLDQTRPPDKYEFNRVVFGVNSSPFLAQFVTQIHAENNKTEFPLAAETVLKSTYMDDCMDSVTDDETAIELHRQLSELWTRAGMHARKWLSNSVKLLMEIPEKDRANDIDLVEGHLPSVKTLGVMWSSKEDVFSFKVTEPDRTEWTKRSFLSTVAKLFDPLGFLGPFTVRGKIIMQDMWLAGLDWDECLDSEMRDRVLQWLGELSDLTTVKVPRCLVSVLSQKREEMELHTFTDASESAYGAVTYARTFLDGQVAIRLIAAKSRVAPIDAMSVPRLELVAAIIGLRLALKISKVLDVQRTQLTFWTDSTNVLWWIRGRSKNCKPFVANRIAEIQRSTEVNQWRHVTSHENPADMLSRGMNATALRNSECWWEGPTFLKQDEDIWPEKVFPVKVESASTEMKRQFRTLVVSQTETTDRQSWRLQPDRFSTWKRLIRTYAWVHRFIRNCQLQKSEKIVGELTIEEIEDAKINHIVQTQKECFSEEYTALSKGRQIPHSSKLLSLRPILDEDGLMRMDGRLKRAEFIAPGARSPIILPRRSWITKLIVRDYHEKGNHATGTNQTLASLSTKFWIVSAREAIREWEYECAQCKRQKTKPAKQVMAPLPVCRYSTSLRAFTQCAVDYAGPFITVQGRGKRRTKRYLCLFTCLSTRAVHLELAYKLDTDSFLNALYRMTSRRGVPEEMLSDNGTNFVGAVKELKQLVSDLDQEKLLKTASNQGMKWKFNPPSAPHFGGVFESMIKSAKKAIYAILSSADVSDEELMTAFAGAEALINSRPLTYQSADPRDDTPLTPNHFLHGQAGGQFAPAVDREENEHFHPRKRWRHVQNLMKHVWRRWLREWLPQLNSTKKWYREERDFQIGDIVLVVNPDTPRGEWPLGRVVQTFPGADGHVRVVELQMGGRQFTRPVTKLCPLKCG